MEQEEYKKLKREDLVCNGRGEGGIVAGWIDKETIGIFDPKTKVVDDEIAENIILLMKAEDLKNLDKILPGKVELKPERP